MRRLTGRIVLTCMVGALTSGLTGCVTPSHDEAKNAAVSRWQSARSGISYGQALQQFEVGDLEKAERTINRTLETMPDNGRYRVLAARIALEQNKLERAFRHLEAAVEAEPDFAQAHYYTGIVLQRWRQHEAALSAYETAYDKDPENVAGLLAVGEMLATLGRTDEAIDRLGEKLVYFEHNAALRVMLGRILMKADQPRRAIELFTEAHLLAPDQPATLEQLAMAQYAAGRFDEAGRHLSQLLEAESYEGRRDFRIALADCYMRTGRLGEARRAYLDLVEADGAAIEAWIALGEVAYVLGDLRNLERAGQRVATLEPTRPEGPLLLGLAAERRERLSEAVEHFRAAAGRAPDEAAPWLLQGAALERMGRVDQAREAYRRAERAEPDSGRAAELLAGLIEHGAR